MELLIRAVAALAIVLLPTCTDVAKGCVQVCEKLAKCHFLPSPLGVTTQNCSERCSLSGEDDATWKIVKACYEEDDCDPIGECLRKDSTVASLSGIGRIRLAAIVAGANDAGVIGCGTPGMSPTRVFLYPSPFEIRTTSAQPEPVSPADAPVMTGSGTASPAPTPPPPPAPSPAPVLREGECEQSGTEARFGFGILTMSGGPYPPTLKIVEGDGTCKISNPERSARLCVRAGQTDIVSLKEKDAGPGDGCEGKFDGGIELGYALHAACEQGEPLCVNGKDDDGDGLMDCSDPACAPQYRTGCSPTPTPTLHDGGMPTDDLDASL